MSTLQANLTPIPAKNECTVLIHISFIKIEKIDNKEVASKIPFDDYEPIKSFVMSGICQTISLNLFENPVSKKLWEQEIAKPVEDYWNLLNYKLGSQLSSFFNEKAKLDEAQTILNKKKEDNENEITRITALIKKNEDQVGITNTNIQVYKGLISDLILVIEKFQPEIDQLLSTNSNISYNLNEYINRKAEYEKKKVDLERYVSDTNKIIDNLKDRLKLHETEEKKIKQAITVLIDFKANKFIPSDPDRDNAVEYIRETISAKDKHKNAPIAQGEYTNEVTWKDPLSLSDVLGYFSAYPEFQKNLGLLIEVKFDKQLLTPLGVLEITCSSFKESNLIVTVPHKVRYELNDNGYFYCASRDSNKYKDGYLNLCFENKYGLLQNSYEEVKYRQIGNQFKNENMSDYTNGFFLVQGDSKNELNTISPGPEYFAEDLLIGYRIDLRRIESPLNSPDKPVVHTWKSLHKRNYTFSFSSEISDITKKEDEGFISANSVTKAFELVRGNKKQETQNSKKEFEILNLNTLELDKIHEFEIAVPIKVEPIILIVKISSNILPPDEQPYVIESINKVKLVVKKPNTLEEFVKEINKTLTNGKAVFANRAVQCDKVGRLYYKGFIRDEADYAETIENPSFIPSSLICHINGYSLSSPKYMGAKLKSFFESPNVGTSNGIEDFMKYNKIRLSITLGNKSLPILRIGDKYQVRCRLVMLGGISLPLSDDNSAYSLEETFLRQDPIPAPRLLFPDVYNDNSESKFSKLKALGDTESQIIIRENSTSTNYPVIATRIIAPPAVLWQTAEWLKMMDIGAEPNAGIMNKARDNKMPIYSNEGKHKDNNLDVLSWNNRTGRLNKYENVSKKVPYIVDSMASYFLIEPINLYSLYEKVGKQDFSNPKKVREEILRVKKNSLENLKVKFNNVFIKGGKAQCKFWDIDPIERRADKDIGFWTLTVKPGGDEINVEIDTGNKVVIISMSKGDDIEFAIRCFTDEKVYLQSLYYSKSDSEIHKVRFGQNPSASKTVLAEKTFRIIYAVQKPTHNPQLEDIPAKGSLNTQQFTPWRDSRYPEDVIMEQGIYFTGRTCGEVYLMAAWQEIIDDITDISANDGSPLRIVYHNKKVFDYSESGFYSSGEPEAQGKFIFPSEKTASPLLIEEVDSNNNTRKRTYSNLEGRNLRFRHELGSTKFHSIKYYLAANSRFNEYYAEGKSKFNKETKEKINPNFSAHNTGWFTKNGSKETEYALYSTKAPLPAEVEYMIPLFEKIPVENYPSYDKKFKGVRIYLKRPWYSSGYGEQLAIITGMKGKNFKDTEYASWVSNSGSDITTSGSRTEVNAYLQKSDVLANTYPLHMTGEKEARVSIAVFPVYFDKTKKLWFADVLFDTNNLKPFYSPFIRLVISRFQNFAVPGQELSLPVVCDFTQIFPDRTLTVKSSNNQIIINAPTIKKYNDTDLSEVHYWFIKKSNYIEFNDTGYLFSYPDQDTVEGKAKYENGQFMINYPQGQKAVIMREYELFTNTNNADQSNFEDRRLLYSYIIKIP